MMVLYYRLFGTKGSFRIAICITGAIVWGWAISIVLESFLLCSPVEFNWNPTLPSGKCGNRNVAFVMAGVLNMVTDLMVMALPLPYIWGLQLPLGRKIGLTLVFCLGLLYAQSSNISQRSLNRTALIFYVTTYSVSAVSIIRVMSLLGIDFNDVTSTLPIPLMRSIVEQQLAIVCANLPLLRHVFAAVLPTRWLGSSRHKTGSGFAAIQVNDGSQKKYGLTLGSIVNKSDIYSGVARDRARPVSPMRWNEDNSWGHSDTELTGRGAPPGGIHVSKEVQVRSN